MDTFNIEKRKVYLTHEPRGNFNTSGVRPLGNLFSLVKIQIGKGYSKSGRFSRRPSINPFLTINFSLVIEIWPKLWIMSWEIFCFECAHTVGTKIFLSLGGLALTDFYLNTVNIIFSIVEWFPRTTLRVNKVTMLKRFILNLLKSNINFEVTWWDGVGRVIRTIIKWSHCIYNVTVRKATLNNPNYLGISHVSIL